MDRTLTTESGLSFTYRSVKYGEYREHRREDDFSDWLMDSVVERITRDGELVFPDDLYVHEVSEIIAAVTKGLMRGK